MQGGGGSSLGKDSLGLKETGKVPKGGGSGKLSRGDGSVLERRGDVRVEKRD